MTELHPLEFEVHRPLDIESVQGNVDYACGLGLPEAVTRRRLDIVANGPSAKNLPWRELGDTMALNGALGLFTNVGLEPTFWAACDPQELVESFLRVAPYDTTYLVCSQCHPSVFDRLSDRKVKLWHLQDDTDLPEGVHVQRHGSSITLTALMLAPSLGYHDIHVWGWDCCFIDGAHHASGSDRPKDVRTLEHRTEPTGPILKSFLTTNTWAFEAQQAVFIVNEMNALGRTTGLTVTVHGPGLVRHTLDFHSSLETSPDANA